MPIFKGGSKLFDVKSGGTDVLEVYAGSTKVFPEAAPTISLAVNDSNVTPGTTVTLTATSGGVAPRTHVFQELLPGGSWTTFSTTTNTTATRVANADGVKYRCQVRDAYYPSQPGVMSNVITMVVEDPFNPLDLFEPSDLGGIWEADECSISGSNPPSPPSNNQAITNIVNKRNSGSLTGSLTSNVGAADRFVYVANSGKPYLRGPSASPAQSWPYTVTLIPNPAPAGISWTCFVVVKQFAASAGANQTLLGNQDTAASSKPNQLAISLPYGGGINLKCSHSGAPVFSPNDVLTATAGQVACYVITQDAATGNNVAQLRAYKNKQTEVKTATHGLNYVAGGAVIARIGNIAQATWYHGGLIINKKLSDAQISSLVDYYLAKYG